MVYFLRKNNREIKTTNRLKVFVHRLLGWKVTIRMEGSK